MSKIAGAIVEHRPHRASNAEVDAFVAVVESRPFLRECIRCSMQSALSNSVLTYSSLSELRASLLKFPSCPLAFMSPQLLAPPRPNVGGDLAMAALRPTAQNHIARRSKSEESGSSSTICTNPNFARRSRNLNRLRPWLAGGARSTSPSASAPGSPDFITATFGPPAYGLVGLLAGLTATPSATAHRSRTA